MTAEFMQLHEVMDQIIDQIVAEGVHDENSELDVLLDIIGHAH